MKTQGSIRLFIAIISIIGLGWASPLMAQTTLLSSEATISLWTYDPIEDIYGAYGHSAVHVHDPVEGFHYIYNYGTFDFDDPDFIAKFVRGRLNYKLSVVRAPNERAYRGFLRRLQQLGKNINQNQLQIDSTQRQSFFDLLEENARPENAYYLYDFFFDNCATRIRDQLVTASGEALYFDDAFIERPLSFRELHKQYMDGRDWLNFGIDFILGGQSDRKSTPEERVYIPMELKKTFDNAYLQSSDSTRIPLLGESQLITRAAPIVMETPWYFSPMFIFWMIFAIALLLTVMSYGKTFQHRWFDHIWFILLGLGGTFVLLMWVGTDHKVTTENWNLLWIHPLHLVAGIGLFFKKARIGWLKYFFKGIFVLTALTLASWLIIPQYFHPAFMPMMLTIMLRGWVRNEN